MLNVSSSIECHWMIMKFSFNRRNLYVLCYIDNMANWKQWEMVIVRTNNNNRLIFHSNRLSYIHWIYILFPVKTLQQIKSNFCLESFAPFDWLEILMNSKYNWNLTEMTTISFLLRNQKDSPNFIVSSQ